MKLSRREFLSAAGGFSGLAALGGVHMRFFESEWFEVTSKPVDTGRLRAPLRVLHLSDFHASQAVTLASIEKAIDLGLEQSPDLVCLTGDFITSTLDNETDYKRVLSKLAHQAPTFACIGNHDGGAWAGRTYGYPDFSRVQALLESSGIEFLFNRSVDITINDQPLRIIGLGDLWSNDLSPDAVLQHKRSDETPIIVLSHNPDSKSILAPYAWDLTLCGHTHGGQLVIPFLGLRPFLPVQDHSFPEGLLSWGKKHIHVTRGVGNLHGMRFNCRPEVSLLELT